MAYNANQQQQYYSSGGDASGYGFGSFEYNVNDQEYNTSASSTQFTPGVGVAPSIFTPQTSSLDSDPFGGQGGSSHDPYADEPPLLEELGINFDHITQKTMAVLNPFKRTDATILHDSDLAGPLVFCLAFGCFLLLSGKVHFGYIYGFGICGCIGIYALLNLMSSPQLPLRFSCTVSVLGYCLLPMVILSGLSILISLQTAIIGNISALLAVLWCSWSASKLFVIALSLENQQAIVAYPCALLYGVFALLTVF